MERRWSAFGYPIEDANNKKELAKPTGVTEDAKFRQSSNSDNNHLGSQRGRIRDLFVVRYTTF